MRGCQYEKKTDDNGQASAAVIGHEDDEGRQWVTHDTIQQKSGSKIVGCLKLNVAKATKRPGISIGHYSNVFRLKIAKDQIDLR